MKTCTWGAISGLLGWALVFVPIAQAQDLAKAQTVHPSSSPFQISPDLQKPAFRIRYQRSESGALITGHGTAFAVNLSGYGKPAPRYLLTAAHNVLNDKGRPYPTLRFEIRKKERIEWVACRALQFDRNLDLALLESGLDLPVLAQLSTVDPELNAAVVLAGSKRGVGVSLHRGPLIKKFYEGSARYLARIPFDHGDSGGPFYDEASGKVIGVAVAGVPLRADLDPNLGLFAPIAAVRSFLAPLKPHRRGRSIGRERLAFRDSEEKMGERAASAEVVTAGARPPVLAATVTKKPMEINRAPQIQITQEQAEFHLPEPKNSVRPVEDLRRLAATRLNEMPTQPQSVRPLRTTRSAPSRIPLLKVQKQVAVASPFKMLKTGIEDVPVTASREIPARYRVQQGDTLYGIARRLKVPYKNLERLNRLEDPNKLAIGMVLILP